MQDEWTQVYVSWLKGTVYETRRTGKSEHWLRYEVGRVCPQLHCVVLSLLFGGMGTDEHSVAPGATHTLDY
jgi:hypothetical protein